MDDFTREYLKRKEENKGVKPQLIPSTSQTFQQVNQASQKQAQTIKQESAKQKASYNTLKQTSGADEARKEYERRISRLQQQKTELTAGLDLDGAARVQDQIDSMRREMNGVSRFESAVTGAIGTYLGSGINALGSLLSPLEKAGNRYSSKSMDAWKALVDNEGLNKRLEDQALTQQERAQIQQQIQRNLSSVELYRQARDNTPFVDSIQRTADLVTQRGTENIEKAKEGLGALGQFAVDTGVALGQYGLDIGAAAVTGGSAMVPMAIRSFGGAQQQARQAGASENQAALYGLASAGLEAATEKIGSVGRISSKFFGGGAIDDVMEGMVASLEKKARTQAGQAALNRIGTAAASFVSEGFEEFVSGVTSPLLERAIYSDDPLAFGEILGDALYDFAVGGAVGAIGGGLGGTDTSRFYNQDMPMDDSRISEQTPGDTAQEIAQEPSFYQGENQASAEQKSQEETREARENAIRRLLEEQGVTGTESAVQARALTSLLDGGEISGKQADTIVKSQAARDVYTQETGEEIDTSGTASEARNRLRQLAAERAAIQVAAQETGTTQVVEQARQAAAEPVQVQQEPRVAQTVAQDGTDLGRITVSAQNIQSVSRMAESSKVLGQAGKAVVSSMYTGETDPGLYVEGAMRAYQDGLNGKRSSVPTGLVRAQYNEIYRAAQQDMVREADPMTRTVTMTSKGGGLIRNRAAARLQDADLIDGLARRLGVKVVADETIMGPDGRQSAANGYIKDGVIHIALDAENPHMEVFKHEATHAIQEKGAKTYQTFRDYAVKLAGEAEVDRVLEQYRSSGVNLSREGAMDEVAADFAGKLLTDEKTVVRMIQDDRNLAQKFFDAIRDLIRRITKSGGQVNSELRRAEALWKKAFEEVQADMRPLTVQEQALLFSDANTRYSIRKKDPPKKTGVAYKVFFAKDGQLYPPMVANPGGEGTPTGVWLDADIGKAAAPSKTGRAQVQAGGKGTNAAKGSLAFRPGWHLGDIPQAKQFARKNPETGVKDLFPSDFVWAECEYAMDVDYQEEAMSYGYTENGKFRHSYAGLPKLPTDGYYRYRTNPNPDTVPWVITGAMKVNRILTDAETDAICREAGVEPMKRQGGPMDEARLAELGLKAGDVTEQNKKFSIKKGLNEYQEDLISAKKELEKFTKTDIFDYSRKEDGTVDSSMISEYIKKKDSLVSKIRRIERRIKELSVQKIESSEPIYSENFKKWFGKWDTPGARHSKVVDENGKPLVVYHGTGTSIEEFNPDFTGQGVDQYGSGFYFTTSKSTADSYQTRRLNDMEKPGGEDNPNVIPAYLNIRNPLVVDASSVSSLYQVPVTPTMASRIIAKAPNIMDKENSILGDFFEEYWETGPNRSMISRLANEYEWTIGSLSTDIFNGNPTEFRQAVKDVLGYDGVQVNFQSGEKHFVAWFPNQIKHATKNSGSYSKSDNRIRYSIKTDSQGRRLTLEQEEYFRDSKAVDNNGNLLVLYHGTGNEFTVFDAGRIEENFQNRGGDLGFYFTPYQSEAAGYARNATGYESDGRVMSVYLNLTNPLIVEDEGWGSAISQADIRHGDLSRWARDGGHDGIIVRSMDYEMDNGEFDSVYIAFYPDQVKNVDNIAPTSDPDIRFSLQRENERLRELNQYLREEISNPDVVRTNRNAVKKEAGKILREYGSDYDRTALTDRMMALYDFIANGKDAQGNELTWSQVNEQATGIARDILDGAVAQGNPLYEEYADVRTKMKSTKIKVDDMYRGDFGQFGGWGEFKKRNAGRIKFSNDGTPSDVVYQELTEMWPELFPEDIINPADQMLHTAEVMQYLSAVYENPYQEELDVYARYLADQILETFYQVPERRTYAQRQRLKQTRHTIKYEKRLSDLRERQKARVEELRRQGRDSVKRAVDAQKESSQKKLEALTKKYQSKEAAGRSRREAAATRAKILRHVNKMSQLLLRPSDKSHVPESLKKPVADLLSSINLESQYTVDPETGKRMKGVNGDPVKRTQAFQELRRAYSEIEKTGEYLIDPDLQDNLDAVISMKDKKLADMSVEELGTVWKAVRAMEASISNANKLLSRSKFESVAALADKIRSENITRSGKKNYASVLGKIDGLINLDMLTPQAYFHRIGNAGDELFRMMRRAADRQTEILKDAQDKTESFLDGIDARKLEKEMHTFQIGTDTLELSTAQIMELYALSRRKQAMDHIYLGGIRTAGARKGIELVGSAEPVHVEPSDVANIVSTLTDEQAQAVRDMQEYLSTTMSEYGNDSSMRVYGYKKFLEKMYWPIRVDKNQTITDVTKEGAEKMVPQYGMTKQLTPNANNALLIGSIFDTYAQHITEMSIYSAWLPTWEDVIRVQNFTFRDPDSGARIGTVKTIIDRIFGRNGNAYLTNLLKDVSQGTKASADTVFSIRGLTSAYKAAAVGANLRVILQQPTAALRALDIIDPKYFLEGMARKGDWETVKKWAPIAQWKDWGYFEMDTGRAIKDVLLGSDSVLDKVKQTSMFAAGKADSLTWTRLWNACAAEIEDKRPNLEKGSDAYYRAVSDRFNEVIDQTQVVDSVLSRTQLMRSSSDLNKMAASFMSEPSKVYNMFLSSVYDLRAASSPSAKEQARKRLGRTTVALVSSFAVNAIAQALIDAMRDDDREKKYLEKFAAAYQKNFTANFNPVGYIPYMRDVSSIIQGYDVARMDMEGISSTISAINNAYKAVQGTGRSSVPAAFAGLFLEASRLLGVPGANLKRDIKAAFMTAAIESDNYLMQYRMDRASLNLNYQGNTALFMDTLYNAMKTDRAAYEIIYADLVKNGVGEDKIASAMESRMKADQGVESVEDLEQRYLPPAQEKKYQASYNKISSSSLWAQASKEQRQELKNDLYTLITGDTKQAQSMLEDISGGAEYGVGQEEYLLFELAKEMASQDGNGHTNQSEALAAVDMVPGLSNEAKAYLWKETTVTGETPAWLDYESEAGAAGIDPWEYILFHEAYYNASSTKDENGKTIEGQSKQDHVRDWLQSSSFTREQQEFLWGTVYKSDY